MKLRLVKKIQNLFIFARKLYFITNSTAYKELKSKGIISSKKSAFL